MNAPARILILALIAPLAACAGAATRFYTLQPGPAPSGPTAYAGPALRIDAVHIPSSLDRNELVRDEAGSRLVVSDNDHWAAPLGELVRRALTQNLAARLPTGKVIYPDAPKPPGSGGLVVDILSLSERGGEVVMKASWTVLPPLGHTAPGQAPPVMRQRSMRFTVPAAGLGVRGDADELSQLTAKLAAAIGDDLAAAS